MSKEKYLFHEVTAKKLAIAVANAVANRGITDFKAGRIAGFLEVLKDSRMPVAAARQIVQDNTDLLEILKQLPGVGLHLTTLIEETFEDLAQRENLASVPPSPPSPLKNLDPADTGFHRE